MNTVELGHWYSISDSGEMVEVVALSDTEKWVEFQHFDGAIESIDVIDWYQLNPIEIAPPEDWSGLYEMERQDTNLDNLFSDYHLSDIKAGPQRLEVKRKR